MPHQQKRQTYKGVHHCAHQNNDALKHKTFMCQYHATDKCQNGHDQKNRQEHAVESFFSLSILFFLVFCVESCVRCCKAQAKQAQITNDTSHQRVQAVFALPQQAQHQGCIHQLHNDIDSR